MHFPRPTSYLNGIIEEAWVLIPLINIRVRNHCLHGLIIDVSYVNHRDLRSGVLLIHTWFTHPALPHDSHIWEFKFNPPLAQLKNLTPSQYITPCWFVNAAIWILFACALRSTRPSFRRLKDPEPNSTRTLHSLWRNLFVTHSGLWRSTYWTVVVISEK